MARRYLFGPVDPAYADENLSEARARGECLTFGSRGMDVTVDQGDSWQDIESKLPQGWRPDFIVLYLPYRTIAPGLWQAPLPLAGLAQDWNLQWHAYRRMLHRCDWVLTDTRGVETLLSQGIDHASFASLFGLGRSSLAEPKESPVRDIDILFVGNLNPAVQRERMAWLGRLALLADRWKVCIAANVFGDAYRDLLGRARIVFNRSIRGECNLRVGEACAAGALLFQEQENQEVAALLKPNQEYIPYSDDNLERLLDYYLTHENDRRRAAAAGQARARKVLPFDRLWQDAVTRIEPHWQTIVERASRRRVTSLTDTLLERTWQALSTSEYSDRELRDDLARALENNPAPGALHNALGVLAGLGRKSNSSSPGEEQALPHFEKATQSDPQEPLYALNYAEALLRAGRFDDAMLAARQGLSLVNRGQTSNRQIADGGHFPPAFDFFRVEWERAGWANAGRPEHEAQEKGQLVRWKLHDLLAKATGDLAHFHEAVLARPDLPSTRASLGRALIRAERPREAVVHLRHALKANPFDAETAKDLFQALGQTGDVHGQEMLSQQPSSPSSTNSEVHRPALMKKASARPLNAPANDVSLCVIVKNEEQTLPACLASVAGLVKEMVVVDTGSTDRTREIARSFGARVIDYVWQDDFAAARNCSVDHASGTWVLWLDADERLDSANREKLRGLVEGIRYDRAAYVMRQFSQAANNQGTASAVDQVRLFRRDPLLRWRYRVHEQILLAIREQNHEVRWTDIVINHSGYEDPALRERKCARNRRLLERELADHPDDPFVLFNLGWLHLQAGQPREALPLLETCRSLITPEISICRKLYALLAACSRSLGNPSQALRWTQEGQNHYRDDIELVFLEGLIQRETNDLVGAVKTLNQLLTIEPDQHFSMRDPDLQGYKAWHELALVNRALGKPAEAERWWRQVVDNRPLCEPAWNGLAELLSTQGKWAEVTAILDNLTSVNAERMKTRMRHARLVVGHSVSTEPAEVNGEGSSTLQAGKESLSFEIVPPCLAPARLRVSLCMIVRNEEANLSDCLNSVRGLVDELIIVDTGSADQTKGIAESFQAKVFDFPWCDSFAAARNHSLAQATGDWIFWLDADDRLDEANRKLLRSLFANLKDENAAYVMKCHCLPDPLTGATTIVDHVRLFRNHPENRWKYRVHEQILPSLRAFGTNVLWSEVVIHHQGYQDKGLRRRKLDRDLRLLIKENSDCPDDPFTLFNLGSVYHELRLPEKAIPLLRRSLGLSQPRDSIVRKLHALIVGCHRTLGQKDEALTACRNGLAVCPEDQELLFLEGILLRERGHWNEAKERFRQLLELPKPTYFASVDSGLRGYKARHNLAVVHQEQGELQEAERLWRHVVNDQPDFIPAWLGLAEIHLSQREMPKLNEVLTELSKLPLAQMESWVLSARIHLGEEAYAEARADLAKAIQQAPDLVWPKVILSHVLLQEGKDWDLAEQTLRDILAIEPDHDGARQNLEILLKQQKRALNNS